MEVLANYLGGVKFEACTRGHRIFCDQPLESGGSDLGMTPPELLLASLVTCAAYYFVQYLNARLLPAEHLSVRVTAEKVPKPAHLDSFEIKITVPGLNERHRLGIQRAVEACLIHKTLLAKPSIETTVDTKVFTHVETYRYT
jgi:putative redox protein